MTLHELQSESATLKLDNPNCYHNVYYIVLASFDGSMNRLLSSPAMLTLGVTYMRLTSAYNVAACDAWVDNGIPLSIFGHSLLFNSLL